MFLGGLVFASLLTGTSSEQVVYGKYFEASGDATDNSFYLFKPEKTAGPLPVIFQFHPGGFVGGQPTTSASAASRAYNEAGIAYASVGYRLVSKKYFYEGADGSNETEELVHVDAEGRLSLDTTGKTMDNYIVRVGRQEHIVKYQYDAAQMMEYVIDHADELGLDPHRVLFTGGSAGGGGINYLTWIYHRWNVDRYTPRAMLYQSAQLVYPVDNMLDRAWSLYTDDIGEDVKLSDILDPSACGDTIGNSMCGGGGSGGTSPYNLCNETWDALARSDICGDRFSTITLGEVKAHQRWPREDPEVGLGFEKLWYTADNMLSHSPAKPFYVYVANGMNGSSAMDMPHQALYSRGYGKYAKQAGHEYTVYYTDYKHMTQDDISDTRVEAAGRFGTEVYNVLSSHDWRSQPGVEDLQATSTDEMVAYSCFVLGLPMPSPSPAPTPTPSPSPGPSPIREACKKALDEACPVGVVCKTCINEQGAPKWIAAGCPTSAEGGAEALIDYCSSRQVGVLV